jgi:hypothetical protein
MKTKLYLNKIAQYIFVFVIIICIASGIIYLFSDEYSIFKIVINSRKNYKYIANYGSILIDDNNKEITILFNYCSDNNKKDLINIKNTYKTIREEFEKKEYSDFNDYLIIIIFRNNGDEFCVLYTNDNNDYLEIHNYIYFEMQDISQCFPDATNVCTCLYQAEDLSGITNFNNLKYLYFPHSITIEQKNYILTIFPHCEIDAVIENST